MREHATQQLSRAYRLDEIAASVATMQSASALEDVARLVLERSCDDGDAQYVHFFHEKIPSRALAECTSLRPLDNVISTRPREAAVLRTRAVARMLKTDWYGAARDLTEGLAMCKNLLDWHNTQEREVHGSGNGDDWERRATALRSDFRLDEKDQPSSLERQLFFHRGSVYLTIACQSINAALDAYHRFQEHDDHTIDGKETPESPGTTRKRNEAKEARARWLEFRKAVRSNARRALRDYTSFLSHFEYTPGLPTDIAERLLGQLSASSPPLSSSSSLSSVSSSSSPSASSERRFRSQQMRLKNIKKDSANSDIPPVTVYKLSELFGERPPENLPPLLCETTTLISTNGTTAPDPNNPFLAGSTYEAATYHPLLPDALHSLLLCHALVQTPPSDLRNHAHMVARLIRVSDGYPIFLSPRSPASAEWADVLRRTSNFIRLAGSWEGLCAGTIGANGLSATITSGNNGGAPGAYQQATNHKNIDNENGKPKHITSPTGGQVPKGASRQEERMQTGAKDESANGKNQDGITLFPPQRRPETKKSFNFCPASERAECISRWILQAPVLPPSETSVKLKGKRCSIMGLSRGHHRAEAWENMEQSGQEQEQELQKPAERGMET